MRRLWFFSLCCALSLGSACSLHSLDGLDHCRGIVESSDCPGPVQSGGSRSMAGSAGNAGTEQGGSVSGSGGTSAGSGGDSATGGTPTMGGSGGEGGGSGGEAGAGPLPPSLVVLYGPRDSGGDPAESNAIIPAVIIQNVSDTPIPLSEVTLRYYYTLEAATTQSFMCDYADGKPVACATGEMQDGTPEILATFGTLTAQEAKHYAEVSFAPVDGEWMLSALGGTTGLLKLRFVNGAFKLQNQLNDYSFDLDKSEDEPELWDRITLYRNGQLIYGVEPQ